MGPRRRIGTAATASSGVISRIEPSAAPDAVHASNCARPSGPAMAMPPRRVSKGSAKPGGGARKNGRAAAISARTVALP